MLRDLQGLDKAAEAQVKTHVQSLGEGGESWVADGMRRGVPASDGTCPFCGQGLTGLDLIGHYRAYFSEGYAQLKLDVAEIIKDIDSTHADGKQAAFERTVGTARQMGQFWANYCDVPPIEIDTEAIVQSWNTARQAVAELLKAKQAAPLEQTELNEHQLNALSTYNAHRQQVKVVNETLTVSNGAILEVKKQAKEANKGEILAELSRLKATKGRFSQDIAPLCAEYLLEKEAKVRTETERTEARKALEEFRANVFPELQVGVNTCNSSDLVS